MLAPVLGQRLDDRVACKVLESSALGVNISQGLFSLPSSGNHFSIDLTTHTFEVNGLTESTYDTISCVPFTICNKPARGAQR